MMKIAISIETPIIGTKSLTFEGQNVPKTYINSIFTIKLYPVNIFKLNVCIMMKIAVSTDPPMFGITRSTFMAYNIGPTKLYTGPKWLFHYNI